MHQQRVENGFPPLPCPHETLAWMASTDSVSVTNPTTESTNAFRLLYRGALSLPDSHILLDGLTFAARLDTPSKHTQLLQNPLALALESMRGRPSLRFMGVVQLDDDKLWLDQSGGIEMDIHPRAMLTRIYFENMFCMMPFASTSKSTSSTPDTSDIGVKVALGDTDGPDTTEIVIFARVSTAETESRSLKLVVARVALRPVPQASTTRLPRPDDPTPRKPPLFFGSNGMSAAKRELKRLPGAGPAVPGRELKRVASVANGATKKPKLPITRGGSILSDLGSDVRLGGDKRGKMVMDTIFKVPEIPLPNTKGKGKAKQMDGEGDVFGGLEMDIGVAGVNGKVENKGKRKRGAQDNEVADSLESPELERTNKNAIKKCVLDHLSNPKDPTMESVDKSHPEFKELYGWIYRGVGFALRSQMTIQLVDAALVERLVKMHVAMYVGGQGGNLRSP